MSGRVNRAVRIGRFLGAPVYLTASWLLFVAVIVPLYARQLYAVRPDLLRAVLLATLLALMWGVSVLLHEFGHVLAARIVRLPVDRVELGFLGGETAIRGRHDRPGEEFWIAASGPAVSILLGLPGLISWLSGHGLGLGLSGTAGMFASAVALANLSIAAFNLLPGLPLDGGRVAVAVIWKVIGNHLRAVQIASYGGQLIGLALGAFAVWLIVTADDMMATRVPLIAALIIMSASLWSMAVRSRQSADREQVLANSSVTEFLTPLDCVDSGDTMDMVVVMTTTPIVLVHDQPTGEVSFLERSAAERAGREARAGSVATRIEPDRILSEESTRLDLLERFRDHSQPWYAVVARDGTPLGIVGSVALTQA